MLGRLREWRPTSTSPSKRSSKPSTTAPITRTSCAGSAKRSWPESVSMRRSTHRWCLRGTNLKGEHLPTSYCVGQTMKKHSDGTVCLEGTRSVPEGWQPCCEVFAGHTTTCAHDLRYEWFKKTQRWGIVIAESAGG